MQYCTFSEWHGFWLTVTYIIIGICRNRHKIILIWVKLIQPCDLKWLWCNNEVGSWPWRVLVKCVVTVGNNSWLSWPVNAWQNKYTSVVHANHYKMALKTKKKVTYVCICRSKSMACWATEVPIFQGRLVQPLAQMAAHLWVTNNNRIFQRISTLDIHWKFI